MATIVPAENDQDSTNLPADRPDNDGKRFSLHSYNIITEPFNHS